MSDPKVPHFNAVKRIVKCLVGSKDKGLIMAPDISKGLECYVDTDFARACDKKNSENPESGSSRTGYVIKHANCPILWVSRLQSEILLSVCESEHIALSTALRDAMPLMALLEEVFEAFNITRNKQIMHCKVLKSNNGVLELAKAPKIRPRTIHVAIKHHYFRAYVKSRKIAIRPIDTDAQQVGIFTKPLALAQFTCLRKLIMGWQIKQRKLHAQIMTTGE